MIKFFYRAMEVGTGEWVTGQLHFYDGKSVIVELKDLTKIHYVDDESIKIALFTRQKIYSNRPDINYITEGDIIRVYKRNGKTFVSQIELKNGCMCIFGLADLVGMMNSICYASQEELKFYNYIPIDLLLQTVEKIEYLGFENGTFLYVSDKYTNKNEKICDNYTYVFGDSINGQTRYSLIRELTYEMNISPENDFASNKFEEQKHNKYIDRLIKNLGKI